MVAVVKRTYYLNEDLDMALKLRGMKDRMGYSTVVIAALEHYLEVNNKEEGHQVLRTLSLPFLMPIKDHMKSLHAQLGSACKSAYFQRVY